MAASIAVSDPKTERSSATPSFALRRRESGALT